MIQRAGFFPVEEHLASPLTHARIAQRTSNHFQQIRDWLVQPGVMYRWMKLWSYPERAADVVALDDALTALAEIDERKTKIVEMRFFGGLSIDETAEVIGVSPGTVMRDWTLAKAWLHREIKKDDGNSR